MKKLLKNLDYKISARPARWVICALVCGAFAIPSMNADAAVVQRGTVARPTAGRAGNSSARMPTAVINAQQSAATTPAPDTTTVPDNAPPPEEITPEPDEEIIIEDKTDQFSDALATANTNIKSGASDTELAEMIRRQRAALDANDATTTANAQMQNALAAGQSACDVGLRNCMKTKCGSDFTKCSGDGDTDFGMKLDSCRRDLKCTGEEFRLYSAEIKADRDMNARLSAYNKILDCGNRYNDCIASECGITYSKCLGKTAGDAAIAACAQIAKECTQQDNGLANRTMQVFATLRQAAEVQVKKDEQRLYELRDKMADACHALGAMFDERSLDCVFTVNFFAANSTTPYASKKAYAGDTFDCNQNWFGIDITTFKENAYRLTREQKSATSAMLGSGVGVATGAITSGAIGRAIDRQKAEKALKQAEKEHEENYGEQTDNKEDAEKSNKKDKKAKADKQDKKADKSNSKDYKKIKKNCESAKGTWNDETHFCSNPQCGENSRWVDIAGECQEYADGEKPMEISDQKSRCELAGGVWSTATCLCPNAGKWNITTGMCEAAPKLNFDTNTTPSLADANKTNPLAAPTLKLENTGPLSNTTSESFSDKLKTTTSTTPGVAQRGVATRK